MSYKTHEYVLETCGDIGAAPIYIEIEEDALTLRQGADTILLDKKDIVDFICLLSEINQL